MASFYSIMSSDDNMIPSSYQTSQLSNDKLYTNEPHVSLSYSNLLPENHISAHGLQESESVTPNYSDQISQYHGLSLTLGSQEQPLVQMHSDLNHYTNAGFCSMLSSNELNLSHQNDEFKNMQYLTFNNTNQEAIKYESATNHFQNQSTEATGILSSSRYLKAAQDLLDELVSVRGALQNSDKIARNADSIDRNVPKAADAKRDCVSSERSESSNSAVHELSASERQDLQDKVTKLFALLDEVDRRYKQYCHQMQAVVSSFDTMAGRGAAQAYTTLALKTISRQFRCLRDAIKKQILSTRKSLGEQDSNANGVGVLSRLRYVDQQLRQQKALQQFGVMRQPWRPQRGLPESAVSILRAWLFEHFLHPYPKDSEKLVLARQTGLTRGQVANWFINARVRLWKPMIEEMYKEEFGEAETEPKSSPERAIATRENPSYNEDYHMQSNDLRPLNAITRAELSYDNAADFQVNEVNFGLQNKQFLALGLQQSEKFNNQQLEGENRVMGNEATSSSSMVLDKLEYYYADPVNNQHKFGNNHLLSDFVS